MTDKLTAEEIANEVYPDQTKDCPDNNCDVCCEMKENREWLIGQINNFASQELSSFKERVMNISEEEISIVYKEKYGIETDNFYEGAIWMRDKILKM